MTDWIVVDTDDDKPTAVPQRQARHDDEVTGTSGRMARAVEPEPEPPLTSPERAEPEPQPLGRSVPASLAATAEPAPSPAPPPVAVASLVRAAGPATPAAPVEPDQRERVRELLQRYVAAFERLDVDAAKAVWPTVDDAALRRAFSQLQAQHLIFESCGITIAGSDANARCRGQATFHPRVGSRPLRLSSREWTFQLARAEDGWQIVDATVR